MLTTEEFLDKFCKNLLTFDDLESLHFCNDFIDTDNYTWEEVEENQDYRIFKIIDEIEKKEQFFIFTKRSYNIFKIDYKYPTFI
ncbi:hypothetical protein [Fusobacterium polymorphum]|uniref:hypothetical protein n=1 Tax=Fusobacterium nucleatum subsp. polymorphum TaxID=76857 RepID=UPI00300B79EA